MEGMIGEIQSDLRLYLNALLDSRMALGVTAAGLLLPVLWLLTGKGKWFAPRGFLSFLVVALVLMVLGEMAAGWFLRTSSPDTFEALRPAAENGYHGNGWVALLFGAELGIPAAFFLASLVYGLFRGIVGWLLAIVGMAAAIGLMEAWLYAGPYISCYGWENCV